MQITLPLKSKKYNYIQHSSSRCLSASSYFLGVGFSTPDTLCGVLGLTRQNNAGIKELGNEVRRRTIRTKYNENTTLPLLLSSSFLSG